MMGVLDPRKDTHRENMPVSEKMIIKETDTTIIVFSMTKYCSAPAPT